MKKTVIFSGTTEGRTLSELLSDRGYRHIVCVASEYGSQMMRRSDCAFVHAGRMDSGEMAAFLASHSFGEGDLLVDATHPYAVSVTENIKAAAGALKCRYIRVSRERSGLSGDHILKYADIEECARELEKHTGNILLATGSKELHAFCEAVSGPVKERTYVRVLPSNESLNLCAMEGIAPARVIAMHGPFGYELNLALMRQYRIRHLVTKESGREGGFEEKVKAAEEAGALVHVLERPAEETGSSVRKVMREILGASADLPQITLAGAGMASEACMTAEVRSALRDADLVFGSGRLLKDISSKESYAVYRASDIIPILEEKKPQKAVILFSGDTGFYSGAKAAAEELKKWRPDAVIRILPGISSVSYLAAKLQESYEDAGLFSLHGRNSRREITSLVREVSHRKKVFVLLSGDEDIRRIAAELESGGISCKIYVGSDLSSPDERIEVLTTEEARRFECSGVLAAMIFNPEPQRRELIPVKRDGEFAKGSVPMTKECVRHESIIRLRLREGDTLYDVGGGTGSVAIEAASLHPGLTVFTVERNPEAAALIRQNADAAGAGNVTVVEGEAPDALQKLPKPDAVFIGGSGGRLKEIAEAVSRKGSGIRYVINAVSLETVLEVRDLALKNGAEDVEAVQLSVSGMVAAGSHHMLRAQNPVFIISFRL